MSSRKEEERNEKVIRGLMKLPPNRRCMNCNSMGPQYVCTNFWTFVCTTCSGIHREFTHRVKSVSMAKFTTQEVEALQKGGNQRAREIYLKHWDSQGHRLPDNSNAYKIREFIRNVYLDKKYAGGGSYDRPPRDTENGRSHEEETRRASSYHSYSQSPPYDFQYEERRYGKHAPVLTRKPGSDRGLYDGKYSSFLSPSHLSDRSPSRLSDHMYEDNFANEQSNSRISDYSVPSAGDPFRSNIQLPNFRRDVGSPSSETSRELSSDDVVQYGGNPNPDSYARRSSGRMLHPQRTASSGSFGSLDSNSLSFKSVNSAGFVDVACEHEQPVEVHYDNKSTLPSLPQPTISGSSEGLDHFTAPFTPETVTSIPLAVNASHSPGLLSTHSMDLLQPSPSSSAPSFSSHQPPQPIPTPSLHVFPKISLQQPAATFSDKSLHVPENEGWATFDTPQHMVPLGAANSTDAEIPSTDANSVGNFNPLLSFVQWPAFDDNSADGHSSLLSPLWNIGLQNVEARANTTSIESWNVFEDSCGKQGKSREQVAVHQSSFSDQYMPTKSKDIDKVGIPTIGSDSLPPIGGISPSPHDSSVFPAGGHLNALDCKSTNPFDLPCDAGINYEDVPQFWDMGSLQAALPNVQISSPFTVDADQHWFAQDPKAIFVPADSEGSFGFIAGHAPSTQILNVPPHGPVASVGGNPFA